MRICAVESCGNKHGARGYCQMHYERFRKHGTTDLVNDEDVAVFTGIKRIDKKIMPVPFSGCWLWIGANRTQGYGGVWYEGRVCRAHIVVFRLVNQISIIPGYELDHLCRVPACVNPDHLEIVTSRINTLRGFAPTAINARKTHCPRGHAFTPDNLMSYEIKKGERRCRICTTAWFRRRRKRKAMEREVLNVER